jgi:signal transduction histidine kinase
MAATDTTPDGAAPIAAAVSAMVAPDGAPAGIEASLVRAAVHELCTPLQYVGHSSRFLRRVWPALRALLEPQAGSASPVPVRLAGMKTVGDLITFLDTEVPDALDRIDEGTAQLDGQLRSLTQLARQDTGAPTPHDPNQLVGVALAVAGGELKYAATVELELGELPLVECHPGAVIRELSRLLLLAARSLRAAHRNSPAGPALLRVTTRVDGHQVAIAMGAGDAQPPHVVHLPIARDPSLTP